MNKENKVARKQVLYWGDSPTVTTGFGTVARNLLKVLHATDKYNFTVFGINYLGNPIDIEKYPYLKFPENGGLWPTADGQDVYGFRKVLSALQQGNWDILFILNDPFILNLPLATILKIRDELKGKKFKIIFYFPTDIAPRPEWVTDVIGKVDFPVAYTEYGRKEVAEVHQGIADKLAVIPHGTDRSIFFPIPGEAKKIVRQNTFGPVKDRFIILNVNRNQPRKDMHRTFAVFAEVKKKVPNAYLYILASMKDVGGDLSEIAAQYGLKHGDDWNCPPAAIYNPNQGMPDEVVNQIYNCADLVMSTTLGEGWGLSVTEAMACKVPVIFPRNTSLEEIIGPNEERGWLAKCGGPDHMISLGPQDNSRIRPVVHVYEMAEKIIKIIRYPRQSEKKIEAAFNWVPTWEQVGRDWVAIFEAASKEDVAEEPVTTASAGEPGDGGRPAETP